MAALRNAIKSEKMRRNVDDAGETIRNLGPKLGLTEGSRGGVRIEAESIYREANKDLQALRLEERRIRNDPSIARDTRGFMLEGNHAQQLTIMRGANRAYRALQPAQQ